MVLTPVCLVQDGINPYVGTTTGVDVTPGATISIKLATPVGPTAWFLEILGTDELTTPPTLTNVNVLTHQVVSPGTIVTFTFPNDMGRAIGFRSTVTGTGGPISTSFGVYSLTTFATRVGFVTETREGDPTYGWASKLNPLIRSGGGGGGSNNYSLIDVQDSQTIPAGQQMLYVGEINIGIDGELIVEGEVVAVDHHENHSVLYIPPATERIVYENDEMLYTDDMVVDGQLTVNGAITDVTPVNFLPSYFHWYNDDLGGVVTNGSDTWTAIPNTLSTNLASTNITRSGSDFTLTDSGIYAVHVQMSWFVANPGIDWLALRVQLASDNSVVAQRASSRNSHTGQDTLGEAGLHAVVVVPTAGDTLRLQYCQPSNGGSGPGSLPTFAGSSCRHSTITIYRIG